MAGFVLDIFVAFIVRWIIIYLRKIKSYNWPTVSGTVIRSHLEKPGFGCMYVVVQYKYKMNFERYRGSVKKPYVYENYADGYIRHVTADSELRIRVSPKNPHRSFPVFV